MKDSQMVFPDPDAFGSPNPPPRATPPSDLGTVPPPGMGDLVEKIHYRTVRKEAVGPVAAPTEIDKNCLEWLCYLMERMLKKFAWYPRQTLSFIAPAAAPVVVAAGATSVIATFQFPQDKAGELMKVGWDCSPPASFGLVTWSLLINGAAHPYFNNLTFSASNLANADEFVVPIGYNSTIELVATNNNLGPVTLNGIMRGFIVVEQEVGT